MDRIHCVCVDLIVHFELCFPGRRTYFQSFFAYLLQTEIRHTMFLAEVDIA